MTDTVGGVGTRLSIGEVVVLLIVFALFAGIGHIVSFLSRDDEMTREEFLTGRRRNG